MSEVHTGGHVVPEASDPIREARARVHENRKQGLAELNRLFREGRIPNPPLDGPYHGELVALDIAPVVTQLLEWLASLWMPWKGKYLIESETRGDNIFATGSRWAIRLMFPFYRGITNYEHAAFRAFVFDTSVQQGKVDPDRQVFRIDYDRKDNPALSIRRIVDEVVQVADGLYLGKIHFRWWWGSWGMLGYFALRRSAHH